MLKALNKTTQVKVGLKLPRGMTNDPSQIVRSYSFLSSEMISLWMFPLKFSAVLLMPRIN